MRSYKRHKWRYANDPEYRARKQAHVRKWRRANKDWVNDKRRYLYALAR